MKEAFSFVSEKLLADAGKRYNNTIQYYIFYLNVRAGRNT